MARKKSKAPKTRGAQRRKRCQDRKKIRRSFGKPRKKRRG